MTKQLIHAYVNQDIYLYLKSNNINLSKTVNDLLSNYIDFENNLPEEEIKVIEMLEEAKINLHNAQKDISRYSAMLSKVRNDFKDYAEEVAERSRVEKELGQRILRDL